MSARNSANLSENGASDAKNLLVNERLLINLFLSAR